MIRIEQRGNMKKTMSLMENIQRQYYLKHLDEFGKEGCVALALATPVDTGKTASSWYYNIRETKTGVIIEWLNSNINNHVNIALILQYGHATATGGYYRGVDYINPAMKPIFDKIAKDAWEEVKKYNEPIGAKISK